MGIYDREYARRDGGGGSTPGRRVSRVSALSVNTWIIIVNVAIHVLANTVLFPWLYEVGHFSTQKGFQQLEVWRLVTFQFLHSPATIWHLFFNMFGLFVFGGLVEEYLGRKKYLAFYLVCGIFGGLAYLLLNLLGQIPGLALPGVLFHDPATSLVGASAGVFGVIMACAFIAPDAIVQLIFPPIPLRMKWFAYGYVALATVNLLAGGANAGGDAAHLGGAAAGYFFIRNSHLLRDFFDVMKDSRREGGSPRPSRHRRSDDEVGKVLAKVRQEGLGSLTEREKRILQRETEAKRSGR
ncbi:MAG TPA: rhomboid family intramembrane serine protease [Phycisphaerales bacterium]|nr:rhomboid family intramembrane serine protease [Phycisphaerales bacterium]